MDNILVIGLGNPILGDDGVGWKVAEHVQMRVENEARPFKHIIEVDFAAVGGLSLMERMIGWKQAILIDAIQTGMHPIGSIRVFPLADLVDVYAGHSASAHDTSLTTALSTAKIMGLPIPESIIVVAIEAENIFAFSDELTPAVAETVPSASDTVMELLGKEAP
jgi:hydrogenase maturation protease